LCQRTLISPPPTSALGGLVTHLQNTATKSFQPSNINFGLLPPLEGRVFKRQRGAAQARRGLADFLAWMEASGLEPAGDIPQLPEEAG